MSEEDRFWVAAGRRYHVEGCKVLASCVSVEAWTREEVSWSRREGEPFTRAERLSPCRICGPEPIEQKYRQSRDPVARPIHPEAGCDCETMLAGPDSYIRFCPTHWSDLRELLEESDPEVGVLLDAIESGDLDGQRRFMRQRLGLSSNQLISRSQP